MGIFKVIHTDQLRSVWEILPEPFLGTISISNTPKKTDH